MKVLASIVFCLLTLVSNSVRASHLFGADLYYTHVAGQTYNINMVVYGDCGGSPAAFQGLYTASPVIEIYDNGVYLQTIFLSPTITGIEVTPVCPGQINNTTCNGGTVPGVRQFSYSTSVNLSPSANWLFRFTGDFMNNTLAGRSNTITNVIAGTQMALEATLNNLNAPNSAPTYTTIPTPFFCINKPAQYNPGAVDADGDGLVFSLVPGLIPGGFPVTYQFPFTATQPLAAAPGSFSFSSATGQLNFNPNLAQNALVVGKVEEYRNGILVGTSMREMTFVVLNTCNNNPPGGNISNPVGGVVINPTTIRTCAGQSSFTFNILPSDLDGDVIHVSIAGLPIGASANITGNNTATPSILFNWNASGVPPGNYTFFVTYTDDGCPLSSKQTVAYTIIISPKPGLNYNLIQPATCFKKAVFQVLPGGTGPFNFSVFFGSSLIHSIPNMSSPQLDSLSPNTYTIRVADGLGCVRDTIISLASHPQILAGFTKTNPVCPGGSDGTITAAPAGGLPPFQYALGTGPFSGNPVFTGLAAGSYTLRIKDANHCVKDTIVVLQPAPQIHSSVQLQKPVCATLANGSITIAASNGTAPYQYALGTGPFSTNPLFSPLAAGTYVLHIKDANNCTKDTTITLTDSLTISANFSIGTVSCTNGSDGSITVNPFGGTNPYTFSLAGSVFGSSNVLNGLTAGTWQIQVKDNNGCIHSTSVVVNEPSPVSASFSITPPSCHAGSDGEIIVNGLGGTPGYLYGINNGTPSPSNVFSGLSAGSYQITIIDNNSCIKDTTVVISEPDPLAFMLQPTHLKCHGDFSGMVTVQASGGTAPFSYSADGGPFQSSNVLSGLSAGLHQITLVDANGCQKDTSVFLDEPAALQFGPMVIHHPTCEDFADGKVSLSAQGGTSPYLFSVNSGSFSNTAVFPGLQEGIWFFQVRDAHNCLIDTNLHLIGYPPIVIDSISISGASCAGAEDGSIQILAKGGNQPLWYAIDDGDWITQPEFEQLNSGQHRIHIIDSTGCRKDTAVMVSAPQVLEIRMAVTNNDCIGYDDGGQIEAIVQGGTAPYSYSWSDGQSGQEARHLANGSYEVVVTDVNGCFDTSRAEVVYDDCCTVFVPSGFTPNGDGRNDKVSVRYKGDMQLLEFAVYNRYGEKIFVSYNMQSGWDGTYNGQPQEVGVYFYYLQVVCGNSRSNIKEFKGDITLIR